MYRKTLRISLFGIEPPVEEALRRAAPLDRFEHAVEAFPTVDGEAFCSCDIAVVNLRLFAGSPGGARPSRCLADLAARRRERLDTFYSAVAVVADAAEAAGMDAARIVRAATVSDVLGEMDTYLEPGDAVLVKASHFMGLTRVVEGLVN